MSTASVDQRMERINERWTDWRPHGRPELEPKTLFMPQHLLEVLHPELSSAQPVYIASMLIGYWRYHEWRNTPEELLIFLRTDLLVRYLDDEQAEKLVHWGVDPIAKDVEERPYLARVCFEVLYEALAANPDIPLMPEVAEAARKHLRHHAEMLESAEAGAGIIASIDGELQIRGLRGLLP